MPPQVLHAGHMAATTRDGHSWHHAGAAMKIVHTAAALVAAWLLHRADVRMTARSAHWKSSPGPPWRPWPRGSRERSPIRTG